MLDASLKDTELTHVRFTKQNKWIVSVLIMILCVLRSHLTPHHQSTFTLESQRQRTNGTTTVVQLLDPPRPSPRGRVYLAGYTSDSLAYCLFDDYNILKPSKHDLENNVSGHDENDILLVGMHYKGLELKEIARDFRGKILMRNRESFGERLHLKNTYYVGPIAKKSKDDHSMQLYLVSYFLLTLLNPKENTFDQGADLLVQLTKKRHPEPAKRKNFLLYINSHCVRYREDAFDALSEIGTVHAGGRCKGRKKQTTNTTKLIKRTGGDFHENSPLFSSYRFVLAMENEVHRGYITEKILNAFVGGAIPIYYGTTEVFDIFNKDAFIFYDINNPNAAIEQVRYLESNSTAYEEMASRPVLKEGIRSLQKYFSLCDGIGNGILRTKIRGMMGIN